MTHGDGSNAINRRDFLKLAAIGALAPVIKSMPARLNPFKNAPGEFPNIIFLIFDALSAHNLSLYGYPRQTTPNFERFASRSMVYHQHYSAGNFTTPSTASLFTGLYPWSHRVFSLSGLIPPQFLPNNLFQIMEKTHHQAVFTQNLYADMLLYQFEQHLDLHQPLDSFSAAGRTFYNHLYPNDAIAGMKSHDLFLFKRDAAHGSLLLSIINDLESMFAASTAAEQLKSIYPQGLPRLANTEVYFSFAQVMQGVMDLVAALPEPFFTYIHLIPPHAPYQPTREFTGMFKDGWQPQAKKRHPLAPRLTQEHMNELRQSYDEYVANVDAEFGRLYAQLENTGLLERSIVVLTSDHGEAFERGVVGHSTPLVLEPVIRIPLVISLPGSTGRTDVHSLSSTVDLLPTLAALTRQPRPDWAEGELLEGFGQPVNPSRRLFVVEAKRNPSFKPLTKATVCLREGPYKLVHYLGYRYGRDNYEFYDLENDPDEINDVYETHPEAQAMKIKLDQALKKADAPYQAA